MQNLESLIFATLLATSVTFLFLWILQHVFKKVFAGQEQEFPETLSFEDRRKSLVMDLVLEKVTFIEKKIVSIDEKLAK